MNGAGARLLGGLIGGLVVAALVACDAGPAATPIPVIAYGTPIEAGPKPDPGRCQELIRADIRAAIRIRTELMTPGIATDEIAVRAAAADPTTDTTTVGIPLTAAELRALARNGIAHEAGDALSWWVDVGAPERFGGQWTRGAADVVAVVHGDPATLALARCVEPANVAYVWADVSLAEGRAVLDRISADTDRWRASGIVINILDYDETSGVLQVGVSLPTAEALAKLQEAYGPMVRLVKEEAPTPA